MDNLTHTALALGVAETASVIRGRSGASTRTALIVASILGNNVSDLDSLYCWITPSPYGYLLHHRGHTHTVLMAVPQMALIMGTFWAVSWFATKRFDLKWTRRDWGWFSGVSLFGIFLHVFADWWNNYGVHPFWPWNNRWQYGDFLFIIEPWIWLALCPFLFVAAKGKVQRWFGAGLFSIGLANLWFVPVFPWPLAAIGTAFGIAWAWFLRRSKPVVRIIAVASVLATMMAAFASTSLRARHEISQLLPKTETDIVLTSFPSDLSCWYVIVAQLEGDRYTLRQGIYSAIPFLRTAQSCMAKRLDWGHGRAPLMASDLPSSKRMIWNGMFVGSRSALTELRERHCEVETYLQFARAPFWTVSTADGKTQIHLGDLRFDSARGMDWAATTIEATPGKADVCPPHRPPWIGPRMSWFGGETWRERRASASGQ